MVKSGLITAAVGFILAIVGALVCPPLCNPCAALVIGLAAGFLAGVFAKPAASGLSAGTGAKAGAIGTIGNLLGQMVGAAINALVIGPEGAAELARDLGFPLADVPSDFSWAGGYYAGVLLSACLCGAIGIGLGAGAGALGGLLWHQIVGKKQAPPAPPWEVASPPQL